MAVFASISPLTSTFLIGGRSISDEPSTTSV
jgi:hypothetical protein